MKKKQEKMQDKRSVFDLKRKQERNGRIFSFDDT